MPQKMRPRTPPEPMVRTRSAQRGGWQQEIRGVEGFRGGVSSSLSRQGSGWGFARGGEMLWKQETRLCSGRVVLLPLAIWRAKVQV
jgi:hypothetical protein